MLMILSFYFLIAQTHNFSPYSQPLLLFPTASMPFRTISSQKLFPISPITAFPTSTTVMPLVTLQEYSPELLSCFGKLRLACGVNQEFSRVLDRFVGSGRLDKIVEILLGEAEILCTSEEHSTVSEFVNDYKAAIAIAQQVTANMSSSDKNQLNVMENLNDTNAEKLFYLTKFESIDKSDRALLQESFNEVMKAFASGIPATETSRALAILTPDELTKIRNLNESQRITHLTDRLRKCNITRSKHIAEDIARLFQVPG